MTALTAEKFASIRIALATRSELAHEVGTEWLFMIAPDFDVKVWAPREGHLTLQLVDIAERVQRTVTVCPGEYKTFAVVTSDRDGVFTLGETHGAHAAFSEALDYLTAPLRAATQHDHDAFAV